MQTKIDIHEQFAFCFNNKPLEPYIYSLSKNLAKGNICINTKEPVATIQESPYKEIQAFADIHSPLITKDINQPAPFVLYNNKLYIHRYFCYESTIIEHLKELINKENECIKDRIKQMQTHTEWIKDNVNQPNKMDNIQFVAVLQALVQNFSIITGGPGTGKTTTLYNILKVIYHTHQKGVKVALAAPTGKAAARMTEALQKNLSNNNDDIEKEIANLKATTIHTLLGYVYHSVNFKYNKKNNNPLPFDWVIIDETSMVDIPMFAKLLGAMGSHCRLILLGDKDQLTSVEAGSLLADLCSAVRHINQFSKERVDYIKSFIPDISNAVSVSTHPSLLSNSIVALKHSYRFGIDSPIGKLSASVLENKENKFKLDDFMDIHGDNEEIVRICIDKSPLLDNSSFKTFCEGYQAYINETDIADAIDKLNKLRVLVVIKEGQRGLYAINKMIEKILNINTDKKELYDNRPIMITKNMHELGLFNGDIGIIKNGEACFKIMGKKEIQKFSPAYLTDIETVFAMTIHKSQGSEFEKVCIVLPDKENEVMTKELLYTGITRAKKEVVIQAPTKEIILTMVEKTIERISGIKERLNKNGV